MPVCEACVISLFTKFCRGSSAIIIKCSLAWLSTFMRLMLEKVTFCSSSVHSVHTRLNSLEGVLLRFRFK